MLVGKHRRSLHRHQRMLPPAYTSWRCRRWTQRSQRCLRTYRRDSRGRGPAIGALVVDAGPLYAYVDSDDAHHSAALELLEGHCGPLIVPTLVITEVAYLLATRLGVAPEVRFLGDLASGALYVEPVAVADWLRSAELVARYRDLPLGTVDASVVAAAERLGVTEIATLDRRDFTVVRQPMSMRSPCFPDGSAEPRVSPSLSAGGRRRTPARRNRTCQPIRRTRGPREDPPSHGRRQRPAPSSLAWPATSRRRRPRRRAAQASSPHRRADSSGMR